MNRLPMAALAVVFAASLLGGCAAALLVPVAQMAGGIAPSSNSVSIDQTAITADMQRTFQQAKIMAVVSSDPSTPYFADALDRSGACEVIAEEPPKTATPSQRRQIMRTVCDQKRADMVMSASAGQTTAGVGSTMTAVFLARSTADIDYTVDVLRCSDRWQGSFPAKVKINQGLMNMDQVKVTQTLGIEFANAIAKLGGKAGPIK